MQKWATRISRPFMMGLAWGLLWVPGGVLVGRLIVGEVEPEWVGAPLYAGFLCGVSFSVSGGRWAVGGAYNLDPSYAVA